MRNWERNVRLTPKQKREARLLCAQRDGYRCMICGTPLTEDQVADSKVVALDHVNWNTRDNRLSNLRDTHRHPCNERRNQSLRRITSNAGQYIRIEKENSEALAIGTTADKIWEKSEYLYPQVLLWLITTIQEVWKEYWQLRHILDNPAPGVDLPPAGRLKRAASKAFFKNIIRAATLQFPIKLETAYSWISPLRNPLNGWLVLREMPEGIMVDFEEPLEHSMNPRKVWKNHEPIGLEFLEND